MHASVVDVKWNAPMVACAKNPVQHCA